MTFAGSATRASPAASHGTRKRGTIILGLGGDNNRYLGSNLAISLVGTAATVPDFQGLSMDIYVAPGTTSIATTCGMTSASGTFGFGLSNTTGTWLTGSIPQACSGLFTMDPPAAGFGHLTGTFAGTLVLLGTNVNLAVTSGSVDVIVPMQ